MRQPNTNQIPPALTQEEQALQNADYRSEAPSGVYSLGPSLADTDTELGEADTTYDTQSVAIPLDIMTGLRGDKKAADPSIRKLDVGEEVAKKNKLKKQIRILTVLSVFFFVAFVALIALFATA